MLKLLFKSFLFLAVLNIALSYVAEMMDVPSGGAEFIRAGNFAYVFFFYFNPQFQALVKAQNEATMKRLDEQLRKGKPPEEDEEKKE